MTTDAVTELRNQIVALARCLRQSGRADHETWTVLMVLGAIERGGGEATPKDLTVELGLRSSNLAQILGDLDRRGLLCRAADMADKRKVRLSLTPAGRRLVQETRAQRDQWLSDAMQACLTAEEQAQLIAAGRLMQRLAQTGRDLAQD